MKVYKVETTNELEDYYDGGAPDISVSTVGICSTIAIANERFDEIVQEAMPLVDENGDYDGGHELLIVEIWEYELDSREDPVRVRKIVIGKEES